VMVPRSSDDGLGWREVSSGAFGDVDAGEKTGPIGPAGKLVPTGNAGLSLGYAARTFSISDKRWSKDEMMARRSSGRSLRPDWILWRSSRTASAAVKDGEQAARVVLVRTCCGSSFTTIADGDVSDLGECL
jgi:hypothetical protein